MVARSSYLQDALSSSELDTPLMDANRTDRLFLRLALCNGGGRLREPTSLGYGVIAAQYCELILNGLLSSISDYPTISEELLRIDFEADLLELDANIERNDPADWTALFTRDFARPGQAFDATTRWLTDHAVWSRRRMSIGRRRGNSETVPAALDAALRADPVRRAIATHILTVVTRKGRKAAPAVTPAWPAGLDSSALDDLFDGLTQIMKIARAGGQQDQAANEGPTPGPV
jgi:hypothetical protein